MSHLSGAQTPLIVASSAASHLGSDNSRQRHRRDRASSYLSNSSPSESRSSLRPARWRRKQERKTRRPRWRKGLVTEAFRKFGEHCARNQIRTLLIDCLVMTNLFYPSLALYLQKKYPPLRSSSPFVYDNHRTLHQVSSTSPQEHQKHPLSFFSFQELFPPPPPLLPRLTWTGWWAQDDWEWKDDGWSAMRDVPDIAEGWTGEGEEVWLMRVGWADVEDVLDRGVDAGERDWEVRDHYLLRLVVDMAEAWEKADPSSGQRCVRQPRQAYLGEDEVDSGPPPCYVLSPLADITDRSVPVISMADLVHASHDSAAVPDGAPPGIYHSFALPFHVKSNSSALFEDKWRTAITTVAKQIEGDAFVEAKAPRTSGGDQNGKWFVSYSSANTSSPYHKALNSNLPAAEPDIISFSPPALIIMIYAILFTILIVQLSNASKAHSRFGLAFTGVVQLCCSSVMSFSVLALLGWNGWGRSDAESSLPTYVLPFVIVVVGAENMSTLTQAIFSIPFSHSVPVRIGLGLSKVGTTIALTSLTDLGILGVVWLCVNLRPVREFCLFAAVVIITDWFMLHTFFLTVLSIDAQRLELADVLASNKVGQISHVEEKKIKGAHDERKQGITFQKMLRARTAKSGSLLLLLFSVGLLYWLTERHRIPSNTTASLYGYTPSVKTTTTSNMPAPTPSAFASSLQNGSVLSAADKLWRALNPAGWPFTQIIVPAASIVILPRTGHSMRPGDIRKLTLPTSRLLIPRLKALFYIFKVGILPQAITAGALYALLLFLLKDAELLDAQRDRLGRIDDMDGDETDSPGGPKDSKSIANHLRAYMLPCSHEADVDIMASSSDGKSAISVAIDNSICFWRFDGSPGIGTREPLPVELDQDDVIVAAALSEDGRLAAVCTASGVVQVCEILEDGTVGVLLPIKVKQCSDRRILGITLDENEPSGEDPFTASEPGEQSKSATVLIACADGSVIAASGQSAKIVIPPQESSRFLCRTRFLRVAGRAMTVLVAGQHDVEMWRKISSGWVSSCLTRDVPKEDRITALSPKTPELPGVLAIGHRSGAVMVYDEIYGQLDLTAQGEVAEGIRRVEVVKPSSMKCVGCGLQSSEGYVVISSTSTLVYLDRIAPRTPTSSFCRCTRRVPTADDVSSTVIHASSPLRKKKSDTLIVPPANLRQRASSGASPIKQPTLLSPVSNGEFPLSSHGGSRRLSNLHNREEEAGKGFSAAQDRMTTTPVSFTSTVIGSPGAGLEATSLGGVVVQGATDGGWTVLDGEVLVGVRRGREGIDDAQWQIWSVDLTAPWDSAGLAVDVIDLPDLLSRTAELEREFSITPTPRSSVEVSMKERRTERLMSMDGRARYPERVGSFSVPTYEALGYVEVCGVERMGENGMMGGFGNRLGIISLKRPEGRKVTPRSSLEVPLGVGGGGSQRMLSSFPLTPPPPRKQDATGSGLGTKKTE